MAIRNCDVCGLVEKKYTCPKCHTFYCSLPCYKVHQTDRCSNMQEKIRIQAVIPESLKSDQVIVDPGELEIETEDKVSTEQLELLSENEKLKELLSNKHLREYLVKLDSAKRPTQAIAAAMNEPLFLEFAEQCLKTIESGSP